MDIDTPRGFRYQEPSLKKRKEKKKGSFEFLLQCDIEVSEVPIKLSNFPKHILEVWKMIFTPNFSPQGSTPERVAGEGQFVGL